RIFPVIGNIRFLILRILQSIAVAADVVPAIHGAAVPGGQRAGVLVAQIARGLVGRARAGDGPFGGLASRGALGAGAAAEGVVGGVVLLDDHDDVLDRDRRRAQRHWVAARGWGGAAA